MTYEETPISKKPSKTAVKKMAKAELNQFGTLHILGHLVMRHKIAIMATGNIILVLNFILPEWFQMVLGLIGR